MPTLANQRHERFVQELAKGQPADAAYEAAGYSTSGAASRVNASRLLTNAKVRLRLAEIQERAARKTETTVESLIGELEEARRDAKVLGQASAQVSATFNKARLLGLVIDKKEDVTPRRTLDQIDARIRQLRQLAAGSEGGTAGSDGRAPANARRDEATPTVPGHGSA